MLANSIKSIKDLRRETRSRSQIESLRFNEIPESIKDLKSARGEENKRRNTNFKKG